MWGTYLDNERPKRELCQLYDSHSSYSKNKFLRSNTNDSHGYMTNFLKED